MKKVYLKDVREWRNKEQYPNTNVENLFVNNQQALSWREIANSNLHVWDKRWARLLPLDTKGAIAKAILLKQEWLINKDIYDHMRKMRATVAVPKISNIETAIKKTAWAVTLTRALVSAQKAAWASTWATALVEPDPAKREEAAEIEGEAQLKLIIAALNEEDT
jgi:hypothetical protein